MKQRKGFLDGGSTGINTCMSHKHHIIPKHAGGTDDPSNLVELSVADHAEAHRVLYEQYGRWQDYVAWQGLAKLSPKEELVRLRQREAGKLRQQLHPNPFKGVRTKKNFALDPEHQKKSSAAANSEASMKKRKNTFAEIQHQQSEKNSQFGTVWCVYKYAIDLSGRKKYNREQIPEGWITTSVWRENRKDKKNNAYGRHWYNDGSTNYYLLPTDEKCKDLRRGRLIKNSVNI